MHLTHWSGFKKTFSQLDLETFWPNWGSPDVSSRIYTQNFTRNPNLRSNILKFFRKFTKNVISTFQKKTISGLYSPFERTIQSLLGRWAVGWWVSAVLRWDLCTGNGRQVARAGDGVDGGEGRARVGFGQSSHRNRHLLLIGTPPFKGLYRAFKRAI